MNANFSRLRIAELNSDNGSLLSVDFPMESAHIRSMSECVDPALHQKTIKMLRAKRIINNMDIGLFETVDIASIGDLS